MKTRILVLLLALGLCARAQPIAVSLGVHQGQTVLLRNGAPYYIKGAGGQTQLDRLVAAGGNSIRTWSVDDARTVLDEAHARGLTVMMGIWMGHERHGMDYDNAGAVRRQFEFVEAAVRELKDHPALLLWGIGNEVDLFYTNTRVWDAVQDVARMIHEVDPNHPTSTVTAGLDSNEVYLIRTRCPDIDIYGVNTYGDLGQVPQNIRKFGWTGPYMITEWGPNGHWEVTKTAWGAPIEQTSEEKAAVYRSRFVDYIEPGKADGLLGSYVFLWGQKQETTETWYGVFDVQGRPTRAVDMLELNWSGRLPQTEAPVLKELRLKGSEVDPNSGMYFCEDRLQASLSIDNPERIPYTVEWSLVPEATDTKAGGDAEKSVAAISGLIRHSGTDGAEIEVPRLEGGYRLCVKVVSPEGTVAYANLPFYAYPKPVGSPQRQWLKWTPVAKDQSLIQP